VDTPCQLPPPTPLERVQYEYLQAEYVRNLGDAMDAATLHGPVMGEDFVLAMHEVAATSLRELLHIQEVLSRQ
jgi:hypothetical protein